MPEQKIDGTRVDGSGADGGRADRIGAERGADAPPIEFVVDCTGCTEVYDIAVVDIAAGGTAEVGSRTHCHESCRAADKAIDKSDAEAI